MATANMTGIMPLVMARDVPLGELLLISIESVSSLIVQYIIGGLAGYLRLVPEQMGSFSMTMNLILIPCLTITSLGRGISFELFFIGGGWVLAVIAFVSSLAYALIALGLRTLAKPDRAFSRLFVVMVAIPNVVAIPIAISEALCMNGAFDDEFHSRAACVQRARAYVFLYISLDAINVWVVACEWVPRMQGPAHVRSTRASLSSLPAPCAQSHT